MTGNPLISIFLSDPSIRVNRRSRHFVIRGSGGITKKVPIFQLGMAVLREGVAVSMDALAATMEHEIPLVYLADGGDLMGYVLPTFRRDPAIRLAQFEYRETEKARYLVTRKLLSSRIRNALSLIQSYPAPGGNLDASSARGELQKTGRAVRSAGGLEMLGEFRERADRDYYRSLGPLFPAGCSFESRFPTVPARDRAGALIAFGQTLLCQEAGKILAYEGLDPDYGFAGEPGKESSDLARELASPLFPGLVDGLAADLSREGALMDEDYRSDFWSEESVFLSDEGQKKFFLHYEKRMTRGGKIPAGRVVLREQVDRFRKALSEGGFDDWKPVEYPGGGE